MWQELKCRIDAVSKICASMPSLDISHIVGIRKQEITTELALLANERESTIRFVKGLNEDFAAHLLTKSDFDFIYWKYAQKSDRIDKTMRTAETLTISNNLETEIFDWLEQYKPFFSFESLTRPLLAYLVERITVGLNKEVCVEFLHEQKFQFLNMAAEML